MVSKKGFTLLELMIAIAIAAIMAAIAVPNFLDWLPDYRLKSAARNLFSDFQSARMQAVKTNSDWTIVFDVANQQYLVCSESGVDGDWSATDDNVKEKIVELTEYGSGVRFGHGDATSPIGSTFGDNITYTAPEANVGLFNSRGTCSGGYVYIENSKGTTYGVGTQSTGVVRLLKWNGSNWE